MKDFLKGWLIPLIALAALAALIWFVGPLLAIGDVEPLDPELNRIGLIGLIVLIWLGFKLRALLKTRRDEKKMLDGLVAAPPDAAAQESAEEIAALRKRLEEALGVLRKARLGGKAGRQSVYQLPWYILIGPPGSGKTTALVNSGLNFPLANQFGKDAIRGIGGTRNCDWWFTDEAVLLDTAGRYTTQDSHAAVDKAAWEGFLDLLKTHRRRRPINGALVAISIADLMQTSEAERSAHARAIRARVQELHERLGIRFPIYVLLTKADLIAGFTEFFDDLGREDREQVWGATFPVDEPSAAEAPVARLRAELDALEARLSARVVERLQAERDPARRALIYGFPKQFSGFRDVAGRFIEEVFRPSAYEERALLRGVYFTSGTQEGTPIDRLMASMAATFNLGRAQLSAFSGTGRSYFLTRLFREVVFTEQGLAGTNLKLERRRAWLQRGAWATVLALTLGAAALWWTSYSGNRELIAQVDGKVQNARQMIGAITPEQRDVLAVLPLLDAVRGLPGGYGDRDASASWRLGFGLYQGDMLGSEATSVYRKLLRGVLLPRLILRIEAQLRQPGANPDFLYEGLKSYLMLEDPDHYDAGTIKAWIVFDWDASLPRDVTQEQRAALRAHLDALFEKRPLPLPLALDQNLIAQVRATLNRMPMAVRVYARLKRSAQNDKLPEFRLSEAAGRDAALVFARRSGKALNEAGIPGLYTYRGYRESFVRSGTEAVAQFAAESWILGEQGRITPADIPQLGTDVKALYLKDYQRAWEDLLNDLTIAPFPNLAQAVDVLRVLSGPGSPLKRLLEAVAKETDLTREEGPLAGVTKQAEGTVDKLKAQLGALIGQAPEAAPAAAAPAIDPVTARFAELAALARKEGEAGPPPIDRTLAGLNDLYEKLNTLATTSGETLVKTAAAQAVQSASKLKLDAERQPAPVKGMLQTVADSANQITMGSARGQLNALWRAEVFDFYSQSLAGRYPLARGSARDAGLEDFAQFFAPDGRIDRFFRNYLASYVDTSTKPWSWQPNAPEKLGIGAGVLVQFQRAAAIRDAFFRAGSTAPSVKFELKPVAMDPELQQFLFDFDGQQVSYAHGPVRATAMQWPSPGGSGTVQVTINPPGNSGRSGISADGPWGLFRLLDQQSVSAQGPDRFAVTFNVDGRRANFELRAASAFNPFRLPELSAFACPERL